MDAEHNDEEFVGLRVSGHTRQKNDLPPEQAQHGMPVTSWNPKKLPLQME